MSFQFFCVWGVCLFIFVTCFHSKLLWRNLFCQEQQTFLFVLLQCAASTCLLFWFYFISTALASRSVEGVVGSQLFLGSRPTQSALFPTRVFRNNRGCWESSRTSACTSLKCFLLWTRCDFRCIFSALQLWHESMFSLIRRNLSASAVGVYAPLEPPLFDEIIKQWKKSERFSFQNLSIIMFILVVSLFYSKRTLLLQRDKFCWCCILEWLRLCRGTQWYSCDLHCNSRGAS